ncbi:MAG TPA: response regulator, partial [Polyangiaceae bacterium LLY-WYZ-15_(1-7)]|nr:response regulator [Polyangiaceae bacterium LLY-WYZ-15_(1-7)]
LAKPLRSAGHEVLRARDRAALDAALEDGAPPAAAFVARRLPGGDALDEAPPIPSVLVSLDEADREAARAARLAGFLPVPFQAGDVLGALGVSTRSTRVVLLADDSDLVHRHVTPILEDAGYEVVHAYDGDQALALVPEARPDLVITDVEMPGQDGYEVCHALKTHPDTAHLPVLICSSLGEAADLERGFDVGADDYLVKPVVPEDLLMRVRDLIAEKALGGRERVLVVDDSPAIRHLVADALTRQGFEVTTARDGREALDALKIDAADPFELVVTDYDMPRMTGFELVHALKRDERLGELPVLMLTARDTKRDRAQMRAAGLTAYLVKPFSADKCVAMVERMLAERRLQAYKEASRLYISQAAAKAAEAQAAGEMFSYRAKEGTMSILFSDLAGFTAMSAQMDAGAVVERLNGYFDAMCPVIQARGGDIDKFIGDAIMAVFEDAPELEEDHALRAAKAAWEMQRALDVYNAIHEGPPLKMRIGVNSGPCVRGDLGSRFVRRDYTVIGDTVNRAQRHESKAPKGGVLLSADTWARVKEHVKVEPLEGLELKGIAEPVTGYVLVGLVEDDDDDDW